MYLKLPWKKKVKWQKVVEIIVPRDQESKYSNDFSEENSSNTLKDGSINQLGGENTWRYFRQEVQDNCHLKSILKQTKTS